MASAVLMQVAQLSPVVRLIRAIGTTSNLHKAHQYLLHFAGATRSMLNFETQSRNRESTIALDRKA